jgi:hypothetical protein
MTDPPFCFLRAVPSLVHNQADVSRWRRSMASIRRWKREANAHYLGGASPGHGATASLKLAPNDDAGGHQP